MAEPHTTLGTGRFEVKASAADHFAWIRTRLALERTIMSCALRWR
jgi:putative membrane protein